MMNRWKISVEIDLKKLLIAGVMALSVWLAIKIGCADCLFFVVPAGIATLFERG